MVYSNVAVACWVTRPKSISFGTALAFCHWKVLCLGTLLYFGGAFVCFGVSSLVPCFGAMSLDVRHHYLVCNLTKMISRQGVLLQERLKTGAVLGLFPCFGVDASVLNLWLFVDAFTMRTRAVIASLIEVLMPFPYCLGDRLLSCCLPKAIAFYRSEFVRHVVDYFLWRTFLLFDVCLKASVKCVVTARPCFRESGAAGWCKDQYSV